MFTYDILIDSYKKDLSNQLINFIKYVTNRFINYNKPFAPVVWKEQEEPGFFVSY